MFCSKPKLYTLFLLVTTLFLIVPLNSCGTGGGGGGEDGTTVDTPTDVPETPSNVITNPIRENSTPVGLSTFAMGVVGKFPLEDSQTPEQIGYKSVARTVRHIATNELYTFPETPNHQQIIDTVKFFVAKGHLVTHEIHILNGPSMRKSRDRWINGVMGRNTSDHDFVDALQNNQKVRDAVQNLFVEVVAYAKLVDIAGADVLICPELEDNQTKDTFNILVGMLEKAGWTDRTKMVRNGGHPGDHGVIRYESHNVGDLQLRAGDIFNNDGNTYCLDSKPNCAPGALTEATIRNIVNHTEVKGIINFIWSAHLQGLQQTSPGNFVPYPEYTNRHYVMEKPVEQASLLLQLPKEQVTVTVGSVAPSPTPASTPGAGEVVPSTPSPTVVVTPTPTKEPSRPVIADPGTPVVKLACSSYFNGKDGNSGFVNNPDNSKGTLKVVLPNRYTGRIVEVTVWTDDGSFVERFYNLQPGEYDNRERFYGRKPIAQYPENLVIGIRLSNNTVECVKVADPHVRLD